MKNKLFKLLLIIVAVAVSENAVAQAVSFMPEQFTVNSGIVDKLSAVADMNNDDLDDIVLITDFANMQISYQQEDGSFMSTVFNISFIDVWLYSITVGDIDNNGYNDVVLGQENDKVDIYFANNTGTDYTLLSHTDSEVFSQRGTMFDIDVDGDLDIFMLHDEGENLVLKNEGNQSLIADQSLLTITNPLMGLDLEGNYGAIWVDYDNDNDTDLYISKCKAGVDSPTDKRRVNLLYRNNGDGTFTDVAETAGLADGDQSWATAFEDFDLDGDFDAFIVNHTGTNKFMLNNGDGTFTDITATTGIEVAAVNANEIDSFDFNNDGYMDIYSQLNKELYINNGDLTFTGVDLDFNQNRDDIEANGGPANIFETGSVGDLNNDGFLDVYDSQMNIQYNQGNDNNWLKLKLAGNTSTLQGVGASVEVVSNLGTQTKEMRIGTSYGIQNTNTMHFGLGQDTEITSVTVNWPSGTIDQIVSPTINDLLTVTEGAHPLAIEENEINAIKIYPNPVRDYMYVEATNSDAIEAVSILDINGRVVYQQVLSENSTHISINLKALIAGMYFAEISFKNQPTKSIKKVLKIN